MQFYTVAAPSADAFSTVKGLRDEQLALGEREIYVYYREGMSSSKLQTHSAKTGTARNMNTVVKLVEMASSVKT
jgi:uncharacterized protein (DUF1697 family)